MAWSGHHVTLVGHCKNLTVPWSGHHVTVVGHCKNLPVPWSGHHFTLVGHCNIVRGCALEWSSRYSRWSL